MDWGIHPDVDDRGGHDETAGGRQQGFVEFEASVRATQPEGPVAELV
jgi:hypothetical protein